MSGTLVLGIGNRLGGDDGAGTHVVDMLNRRRKRATVSSTPEIMAIDTGTAPESYTSVIRQHRPDLLIMVDAADMGLPPGALRIIPPEKISVLYFSTHHMPLSVFVSYVKGFCGKVLLVGVQPEVTSMSKCLSVVVRKGVKELVEVILEGGVAEIPLLT